MLAAERAMGKDSVYRRLPHAARVAVTFVIVLFSWVFFRAADLPSALAYCRSMLGFAVPHPGSGLIDGVIYQPYYIGMLLVAGVIAWGGPQTWDWTRTITPAKALLIALLFWLSLLVMTTQAFNPFIYFIF
jgi:alginate O-acetyltransferase complex protein AlgI